MKKLVFYIFALIATALFGCGGGGGTSAEDVFKPPPEDENSQLANFDLTASKFTLQTDGSDFITLNVIAADSKNAALPGAVINLSATGGLLSKNHIITDDSGTGEALLKVGALKNNQTITVTASAGTIQRSLPIAVDGSSLSLTADKTSVLSGLGHVINLTGEAKDSGNLPINGATLTLSSAAGNSLHGINRVNGQDVVVSGASIPLTTNPSGRITATFTGNIVGNDTLTLSGLGTQFLLPVTVTNASFAFISPANNTIVPVDGSQTLKVRWLNSSGNPVSGKVVFSVNVGSFKQGAENVVLTSPISLVNGEAAVTYIASNITSPATVTATGTSNVAGEPPLNAVLNLDVRSLNPARIDLQISPTVIPTSWGGISSAATVTATVRDANGQFVAGQLVTFNLVKGPGGGEYLSPTTVRTDSSGKATTTFVAGSATSSLDGVEVRASTGQYFDTATLTIGQQAARITFGSTNKIRRVSSNGVEIGYALPFVLVVTDNNGVAIPNAVISLGVRPEKFSTGYWQGTGTYVITGSFYNEDLNSNGILDPGEDGARGERYTFSDTNEDGTLDLVVLPAYYLDQNEYEMTDPLPSVPMNTNGRLDPGNPVTISPTVMTDENGLAGFEVFYPKSFGAWVSVRIQATTEVTGSETQASLVETLGVMDGDVPRINSPFGN